MNMRIEMIFADNQESLRKLMIGVLAQEGIDTIGEAGHGKALLALLRIRLPDVLLMSLELDGTGPEGALLFRTVRQLYPQLKVIIFSAYGEGGLRRSFKEMGANSYLVKTMPLEMIVETIKNVYSSPGYNNVGNDVVTIFTRREIELITLIVSGKTSREIGDTLNLSFRTVEAARYRLYVKTNSKNASEFGVYCGRTGLNFLALGSDLFP
jgi:DNA-binding NarL/FixJ family response regulator